MIAEAGAALLWLAAACAALQAVAGLASVLRIGDLAVPAALAQAWLWLWLLGCLAWIFVNSDMSVAAVAANTHRRLPDGLKLAAVVLRGDGDWRGIGLMATLVTAWTGAALAWHRHASRRVVGLVGSVAIVLYAVLLSTGPFSRLEPAPTDGAGFGTAWRDGLARIGLPGPMMVAAPLTVGETQRGGNVAVTLVDLKPVAGSDWTGVEAVLRVTTADGDTTVLHPRWRETLLPRHAAPIISLSRGEAGSFTAILGAPRGLQWPVTVRRVAVLPLLAGLGLAGATLVAVLHRRRRR